MTSFHVALAWLLLVYTLQAVPAACNQPVPRDLRPNGGQECKPEPLKAWCGAVAPTGADAALNGLPGQWATPAVQSNPDAVAEPRAVTTVANPLPQFDQAMLHEVRVRLLNLVSLWLLDLAQPRCGEAVPSVADAAHKGLPDDWATPTVQRNYWPLVRQPKKGLPNAVTGPLAVSTDANPPPQLNQALLEAVRVRLRNLGFLGLTDVSDASLAEAVIRFQASINIPETGVLNRDTLGRLLVP